VGFEEEEGWTLKVEGFSDCFCRWRSVAMTLIQSMVLFRNDPDSVAALHRNDVYPFESIIRVNSG
jgi:hypothetical protein